MSADGVVFLWGGRETGRSSGCMLIPQHQRSVCGPVGQGLNGMEPKHLTVPPGRLFAVRHVDFDMIQLQRCLLGWGDETRYDAVAIASSSSAFNRTETM